MGGQKFNRRCCALIQSRVRLGSTAFASVLIDEFRIKQVVTGALPSGNMVGTRHRFRIEIIDEVFRFPATVACSRSLV